MGSSHFQTLIKKLYKSAELQAGLNQASMVIYGLAIIPLLVNKLDAAELSAWFLFGTIAGFEAIFALGFPAVGSRAIIFFRSGAENLPSTRDGWRETLKNRSTSEGDPNWPMIHGVSEALRKYLGVIGLLFFVVGIALGFFLLQTPLENADHPGLMQVSLLLYCLSVAITLCFSNFASIIFVGFERIELSEFLAALRNIVRIVLTALVLTLGGSLLGVVIVSLVVSVLHSSVALRLARQLLPRRNDRTAGHLQYLKLLWPACKHTSVGSLGKFLRGHGDAIVVSRLPDPGIIAGYLLLKRILSLLLTLQAVLVGARVPMITKWRMENRLEDIAKLILPRTGVAIIIFAIGCLGIWPFIPLLLEYVGKHSGVELPAFGVYLLLALSILIMMLFNIHGWIYTTTNDVARLTYPALATSFLVIITQLLIIENYGLTGILMVAIALDMPMLLFSLHCACESLDIGRRKWLRYLFSPHLSFPSLTAQLLGALRSRSKG